MNVFEFSFITAASALNWVDTLITLTLREISTADMELSFGFPEYFFKTLQHSFNLSCCLFNLNSVFSDELMKESLSSCCAALAVMYFFASFKFWIHLIVGRSKRVLICKINI